MGAHAETHDELTGVAGELRKSCAAVKHLAAVGLKTDVLVILNRRNCRRNPGLSRLRSQSRRATPRHPSPLSARPGQARLGGVRPLTRGADIGDRKPSGARRLSGHAVLASQRSKLLLARSNRECLGDSIGCTYLREYVNFGNIRTTPFLDTWHNDELYRSLREGEVEKSCASCHDKDGTEGGCRSTAYAFHGRWDAPDPFCSHLNNGVDLRVLPQRLLQENI